MTRMTQEHALLPNGWRQRGPAFMRGKRRRRRQNRHTLWVGACRRIALRADDTGTPAPLKVGCRRERGPSKSRKTHRTKRRRRRALRASEESPLRRPRNIEYEAGCPSLANLPETFEIKTVYCDANGTPKVS